MSEVNTGTANENEQQESPQTSIRTGYDPTLRWEEADPIYADKMNNMMDGIDGSLVGVKINSINLAVNDREVNIPIADSNNLGVIKINSAKGIKINNGVLEINSATTADINNGTEASKPIVPSTLKDATYKGLAELTTVNIIWRTNYYINNTDGTEVILNDAYSTTQYIPIIEDYKLEFNTIIKDNNSNVTPICAFYDQDQNFLKACITKVAGQSDYSFNDLVPHNASYLKITCSSDSKSNVTIKLYDIIANISNSYNRIKNISNIDIDLSANAIAVGKYLNQSAGLTDDASSYCTDFIKVIPGHWVTLVNAFTNGARTIWQYNTNDSNATIKKVVNHQHKSTVTFQVDPECEYIRVTGRRLTSQNNAIIPIYAYYSNLPQTMYSKPQAGIPLSDLDATGGNCNMYLSYNNTNKVGWSELPFALNSADIQDPNPSSPKIISNAIQDKSVFYGLASAAGDETQSQITIGNNRPYAYTDSAKQAICNLLGARSKQDSTIAYVAPTKTSREYTDFVFGNDTNAGTLTAPFATVAKALADPKIETIIVTPGDYYESVTIRNRKIQIICLPRQYHYQTTNGQGNEVTVSEYLYDAIFHHPARKEITDAGYVDRNIGAMGIFLLYDSIFEFDHIQAWDNARYNGGYGFCIYNSAGILRNCVASNNEQTGYYFSRCNITCYNCVAYSNGTRARTLKAPETITIDGATYTIITEYAEGEAGGEINGARFGFRAADCAITCYNCASYNNPMTGYRLSGEQSKGIFINCVSYNNGGQGLYNETGSINICNGEYYNNKIDGILLVGNSQGEISGIYAHDNNTDSGNYAGIRLDYNGSEDPPPLSTIILHNNIIENNYFGVILNKHKVILTSNIFYGHTSYSTIKINNPEITIVKNYNSIIIPST